MLVERVEGLATPTLWRRAYAEIRQVEEELTEHGIILVKYWLHITSDEQARRFEERAKSPYKSWKLTEEDWRNRQQWDLYELAVNDMVEEHTSTRHAPWHLIAANDKNHARVEVLRLAGDATRGRAPPLTSARAPRAVLNLPARHRPGATQNQTPRQIGSARCR